LILKEEKMNKILIAGTGSGCGKTTVTCALLKALANRNIKIQPFKCGPDYIDPMFHSYITGTPSRNLDSYFLKNEELKFLFQKNSKGKEISVIEGVMGYYDGAGTSLKGSAYEISSILSVPVILVVNGKGIGISAAAVIKGFLDFQKHTNIKGIIINGIKKSTYLYYKGIIERETGLPLLGYLPYDERVMIKSRYLGLITSQEMEDLNEKVEILGQFAEETLEIDRILKIAESEEQTEKQTEKEPEFVKIIQRFKEDGKKEKVRIAVAKDRAFCFYYEDNLDLLRELGAELIFFSPLKSVGLPENIDGLYLGGGYPEIYAKELERNSGMRKEIFQFCRGGKPVIAECGGYMYLCKRIVRKNGAVHRMAGVFEEDIILTEELGPFGYVEIEAKKTGLIGEKGWKMRGHEFHYSRTTACDGDFILKKSTGRTWATGRSSLSIYAGYPHLYFYSNVKVPCRFIEAAGYVRVEKINDKFRNIIEI
jgi:cobyrinic acid a,c-diamide synthase